MQGVDASWIDTDKKPAIKKAIGTDTLNIVNHVIAHSGMLITAPVPDMGDFEIVSIQTTRDTSWCLVVCKQPDGKEFSYWRPWYTKFSLYLGER